VHTSGTKPAIYLLGFYVVSCNYPNALAKNIFPLIAKKLFLKKTKKGGMALPDVTNRGGVQGGIPPGHSQYHRHLQKPRAKQFSLLLLDT
jgi:hypothetical protein